MTKWDKARELWKDTPRPARIAALLLIVFLLGMCAGCAGKPVVTEVRVPVPIVCQEPIPDRPAMPTDNLKPTDDLDRKVAAALAEIHERDGYETKLLAALVACTVPL